MEPVRTVNSRADYTLSPIQYDYQRETLPPPLTLLRTPWRPVLDAPLFEPWSALPLLPPNSKARTLGTGQTSLLMERCRASRPQLSPDTS